MNVTVKPATTAAWTNRRDLFGHRFLSSFAESVVIMMTLVYHVERDHPAVVGVVVNILKCATDLDAAVAARNDGRNE
jgi:hypothetical protein